MNKEKQTLDNLNKDKETVKQISEYIQKCFEDTLKSMNSLTNPQQTTDDSLIRSSTVQLQRLNTKSLEDMEKTLGLDGHLKKAREKVKTVYGIKDKPTGKKRGAVKKDQTSEDSLLQPATLSK